MKVFPFLQNIPETEENFKSSLLWLKTRSLLLEADFQASLAPSSPESLSTPEARHGLFEEFGAFASTPKHTRCLLSLLHLWPPFAESVYESVSGNPWEGLLTRLIGEGGVLGNTLPSALIWETIQHATVLKQVTLWQGNGWTLAG